ncbi:MAG: hypothetical protein Q9191_008164, partial [Dirinaria sp. TL-2023a]
MDENARKRKREEEGGSDTERVDQEKSLEGLKRATKKAKKQKAGDRTAKGTTSSGESKDVAEAATQAGTTAQKTKASKKKEKRERRKVKKAAQAAKKEAKKSKKDQGVEGKTAAQESGSDEEEGVDFMAGDMDKIDVEDIAKEAHDKASSTASPSPFPDSPAFDAPITQSGSSSISSLAPPVVPEEADPKNNTTNSISTHPQNSIADSSSTHPKNSTTDSTSPSAKPATEPSRPKETPEELKLRLQARIEELRAARKADGLNGKPARNRQELLEARRQKEEQRKAHKKALRKQAKEEEERAKAEKLARGSPLLSPGTFGR